MGPVWMGAFRRDRNVEMDPTSGRGLGSGPDGPGSSASAVEDLRIWGQVQIHALRFERKDWRNGAVEVWEIVLQLPNPE